MIYRASPILCSTFKGILPSDLFDRYNCEGGYWKLELDLLVANEIADQLNESVADKKSSKKRGKNAKSAVARRDQRRQLFTPAETSKQLTALLNNERGVNDG